MANEFINVNDIVNAINSVMVENNEGLITASNMKTFLLDIAYRLKTTRQHLSFVSILRGGTPTALDAVDTENIDVGTKITVLINGRLYEYELVEGTGEETELSPFVIVPDEYHDKYWRRTDVIFGNFTNDDLSENKLLITHSARTLYTQIWIYDGDDEIVHGKQWYPGPDPEMNTYLDMGGDITETHKYVLRW